MEIISVIIVGIFILIVILSFALQLYVATLLGGGPFFALRGTKVFAKGWQEAERLGIKPLMSLWTGMILLLLLFTCPLAAVGYMNNTAETSSSSIRRNPTATRIVTRWEITSPRPGDTLHHSDGEVPIIGSIDFNWQQVARYRFWIRGQNQSIGLDFYHERKPQAGSVLGSLNVSVYPPGQWEIALDIYSPEDVNNNRRGPRDDLEWIPIIIAP